MSTLFDLPERVVRRPESGSGYLYDCTPGHKPDRRCHPVGAEVAVYPPRHLGAYWLARVVGHMHADDEDGVFWQITQVEVTDPNGFLNLRVGLKVDVDMREIKPRP